MTRRRVLQIVNGLSPPGGAESVAATLALQASERWEPHLLCLRSEQKSPEAPITPAPGSAGVPVHEISMRGLRDLKSGRAFLRLLGQLRPAVVHAHNRPSDYWAMGYAAWARVPLRIYTRHLTYVDLNGSMRRRYRVAAQLAHRVVAVSSSVAGHLVHEEKCPPPRIVTIPNGVDLGRFDPASAETKQQGAALRSAWGIPDDAILVGSISRITHQKGLDLFLKIAGGVLAEAPDVRFVIAGEGAEKESLMRQTAAQGISGSVVFPGFQEAAPALAAFDLFLSTSRYEGLPLTLLEAMASGLPVVTPRLGAFPEVLEDGVTGFLPSPRFWAPHMETLDCAPFTKAVLRLIGDREERVRIGEAARKRVEQEYGIGTMVSRYEALYERLLGERN